MTIRRRAALLAAASWSAAWCSAPAFAHSHTGSILVPSAPGSFSDAVCRRHASHLSENTRMPWVVENHPGAGGVIAGRQLLARPSDGLTLLWGTSGLICNTPLLAKPPLEYNPASDFIPAAIFVNTPFLLYAGAAFPAGNLAQLQTLGQSRAEPISFMPIDLGSANHLAAQTLLQRLGLRGSPIAYRNVAQGVLDIGEGRVELGISAIPAAMPAIRSGKLKALALLADSPSHAAPGAVPVPVQGFGSFDVKGWSGLFLARNTAHSHVAEHQRHVQSVLATPALSDFLRDAGQEIEFRDHARSRTFVEAEVIRNRSLMAALKLI